MNEWADELYFGVGDDYELIRDTVIVMTIVALWYKKRDIWENHDLLCFLLFFAY